MATERDSQVMMPFDADPRVEWQCQDESPLCVSCGHVCEKEAKHGVCSKCTSKVNLNKAELRQGKKKPLEVLGDSMDAFAGAVVAMTGFNEKDSLHDDHVDPLENMKISGETPSGEWEDELKINKCSCGGRGLYSCRSLPEKLLHKINCSEPLCPYPSCSSMSQAGVVESWNLAHSVERKKRNPKSASENIEVRQCPFCGTHDLGVATHLNSEHSDHRIVCNSCFAYGPPSNRKESAAWMWNSDSPSLGSGARRHKDYNKKEFFKR